jgi:hypothetical protein
MKKLFLGAMALACTLSAQVWSCDTSCDLIKDSKLSFTSSWTSANTKMIFDSKDELDAHGSAANLSLELKKQEINKPYYTLGGNYLIGSQDYDQGSTSDEFNISGGGAYLNLGYTFPVMDNLVISPFAGYAWSYSKNTSVNTSNFKVEVKQNQAVVGFDAAYQVTPKISTGVVAGAYYPFSSEFRYTETAGTTTADIESDNLSFYATVPVKWHFADGWVASLDLGVKSLHQKMTNSNSLQGQYRETNYSAGFGLEFKL